MVAKYRSFCGILTLFLLITSVSCKLSLPGRSIPQTNNAPGSSDVAEKTVSEPGQSRSDPIPVGTLVSLPDWDIQVVEFLRGSDALKVINTADWQAQELPEGQEYVLAKVFLRCTSLEESYRSLGISQMFISGDRSLQYGDSMDGWPTPEFLFEDMFSAETVEGWVDAVVPADEQNMMLVVNLSDPQPITRFFALEEPAAITLPKELTNLKISDIGSTSTKPANLDQQMITPNWSIKVVDSIRGAEAETILSTNNDYYALPETGKEYLLLRIEFSYRSPVDVPIWISEYTFYSEDFSGLKVEGSMIYTQTIEDRNWISQNVLPGAQSKGWVALYIPSGASPAVVIFDPNGAQTYSQDADIRYIAIP